MKLEKGLIVERLTQLNNQLMNVDNERTGRNIAQNFADELGVSFDQLQHLLSDTAAGFSDAYILARFQEMQAE